MPLGYTTLIGWISGILAFFWGVVTDTAAGLFRIDSTASFSRLHFAGNTCHRPPHNYSACASCLCLKRVNSESFTKLKSKPRPKKKFARTGSGAHAIASSERCVWSQHIVPGSLGTRLVPVPRRPPHVWSRARAPSPRGGGA